MTEELPFERAAMKNEPLPDNLDYVDSVMYRGLCWLYLCYHMGQMSRDQASKEKKALMRFYHIEKNARRYQELNARVFASMMKECEAAANAYAKERTLENADRLYMALYKVNPKNDD